MKEKGSVDPATVPMEGRLGAYAEPGTPGRVHLAWVGGICDSEITVTVAADLDSITFDMGPQPPNCDSIGVVRQLVLDFSGSVDVPAISLRDVADAANPTSSPPDYTVDCGPLGPDTCEQRARDIVLENQAQDPSKRVVSVTFSADPCGSFTVTFDDGTSAETLIDCFVSASPG